MQICYLGSIILIAIFLHCALLTLPLRIWAVLSSHNENSGSFIFCASCVVLLTLRFELLLRACVGKSGGEAR